MVNLPGIENIDWWSAISLTIKYIGWGIVYSLIIICFVAAYFFLQYKIKVIEIPLFGSGKDNYYSECILTIDLTAWDLSVPRP